MIVVSAGRKSHSDEHAATRIHAKYSFNIHYFKHRHELSRTCGCRKRPARKGLCANQLFAVSFDRQNDPKSSHRRAPVSNSSQAISGRNAGGRTERRVVDGPPKDAGVSAGSRSDRRFHQLSKVAGIRFAQILISRPDCPSVVSKCSHGWIFSKAPLRQHLKSLRWSIYHYCGFAIGCPIQDAACNHPCSSPGGRICDLHCHDGGRLFEVGWSNVH